MSDRSNPDPKLSGSSQPSVSPDSPAPMEFTGERYVPSMRGQIKYEHLHRYAIASQLVAGRDVLDLACGEGYGANLLAKRAASVIGVDNSQDIISYALGKYTKSNLSFVLGTCDSVPLPAASIDVVVSFETIEHHDKHDEMMREIRRVLRPGGLLVISTPDRLKYSDEPHYNNPFHLKEFYYQEFQSLLKKYFENVNIYGQRLATASFVQALEDTQEEKWIGYTGDADHLVQAAGRLQSPLYYIAICSDESLNMQFSIFNSLYLDPEDDLLKEMAREWSQHFSRLEANIAGKTQELVSLATERETLQATAWHQESTIADLNSRIADQNSTIADLNTAVNLLRRDYEAAKESLGAIYSSHGWRVLQRYYQSRDKLLPPNSIRRSIAKFFLIPRISMVKKSVALFRDVRLVTASGLFDRDWYLQQNPDVAESGINPLRHYLQRGAYEGRDPGPLFDSDWYLQQSPDVAKVNLNPLVHFLKYGRAEGRSPQPKYRATPPPASFLPVQIASETPGSKCPIDIIIPVYKGLVETKACIESVLSSSCKTEFRIIVVNDHSPQPELTEFLRELARDKKVRLIENPRNVGFVRSVNAGMKISDRDIVLLNSDTVVFNGWLDRLTQCAYSDERTGTVTPFSNNATICSYPVFCSDNKFSPSIDLGTLNSLFASVNSGRTVEIPTAVGFCMFIRRKCLKQTGLFDANAFGAGYGEENDFCMRAAAKGWKHKLACDVFVYHAGGVSFGDASALQQKAMKVLVSKHRQYPFLVSQHVQANPANAYRIAVTAHRIRNSGKQVFLSVTHAAGGGVAQHVCELNQLTDDRVVWINLRPSLGEASAILECSQYKYQFSITLEPREEYEHLITILRACGVERVHIQHLMGHTLNFPRLLEDLDLPFDFTVHDYYTVCPQVTLSDYQGRYCGEPERSGCDDCLALRPRGGEIVDISSWRAKYMWVLTRADRVIAPSVDAAERIKRYYPEVRVIAAEHPNSPPSGIIKPKRLEDDQSLRVAVLGTMAIHKGLKLLQESAELATQLQSPLEFILVGSIEEGQAENDSAAFSQTGPYESGDLAAVLDRVAPHLVWFPAQCAETFSYTLSTCLELGLPLAVHNIGAFPERVGGRPWTWIRPLGLSATEWVEFFVRIRELYFLSGDEPARPPAHQCAASNFYPDQYLRLSEIHFAPVASHSPRPIRVAAAASTDEHGQIQACGYVRVLQPLTHPVLTDTVRLSVMPPPQLTTAEADVILVQRMAIHDMDVAERLIQTCHARGLQLVYEIDDNLFNIDAEHPEYQHYIEAIEAAKCLAKSADVILTPTEVLRQQLLPLNANTIVLPNYLDDRLWGTPSAPQRFSFDQIRILYAGTISHRHDLEFFGRAVQKLGRHRERVCFDVIGGSSSAAGEWFQRIPVPPRIAASYPRFVEWIQNQNRWHWGVAPLLDNQFNRSKSALKFLEYSALGLPAICSEGPVYGPAVRHGETGLLVANDPEQWRSAMERAISDSQLWARLRGKCRTVAQENTIAANVETIKSLWKAIASGSSAREEAQEVGT